MKAIISTTYDDKYLFCLPIVVWCWNKLGVDVICFMPMIIERSWQGNNELAKSELVNKTIADAGLSVVKQHFYAPQHKEATYAQCSRLYAGALDLPEDEVLVTSDVDMAVFQIPPYRDTELAGITIFGADLVPLGQFPMCYASGKVSAWRRAMRMGDKTPQQCLDEQLAHEEMENMRGNLWCRDQELLFKYAATDSILVKRAREGTQFASHRYDRDDAYLLDRLSLDTIDYHLPRPGYEENNFNQILTVLKYHYPLDDFGWLIHYRNEYLKLL
jgi:hypothetical protein